ncbi:glutamine amidotransferase [Fusarium napiforme]|uniref:Glutamine amidotransferase n=1 Tax=Fusarium napiforme TaxID=42672 RepID=A0A8H5J3T3_9HYPO|nr:glutamine amidotransferase [Fusarium napiforme]
MASFEGKVIAIAGAACGIGLAVAKLLASCRTQLSLADINKAGLEAAIKSLPGDGHIITQVDVCVSQEVNLWIEKTVSVFGKLDGAVNMAGVFTHGTCLRDETDDTWDFIMGVNARGVFNCLRAELKHMKSGGSIVSAASVDGQAGFANASVYCASKHAVIGMSRSAAKENENIRINCVAPGSVRTPMMEGEVMAEAVEADVAQQVQKRHTKPHKIANVIAFLLNDKASLVTGAVYNVDGRWVAETWGPTYSSIFAHRLQAVNKTLGSDKLLQISAFDIIKDEYPDPKEFDAFLITGSIKGVYDEDPWIARLKTFIQETYQNYKHVRLFGACFGHQIISEALLEKYGVIVEKDPKGYEVGIHKVALNPKFRAQFSHILSLPEGDGLRIQFAHGDHVRFEGAWPESWMSIGSTSHCALQGIFQPGHVLTFQGHFEFTEEISTETIKYFYTPERGFTSEQTQAALDQIRGKDDSEEAAKILHAFFTENNDV